MVIAIRFRTQDYSGDIDPRYPGTSRQSPAWPARGRQEGAQGQGGGAKPGAMPGEHKTCCSLVLFCTILYHVLFCSIMLCYVILDHVIVYYFPHYSTLYYITVYGNIGASMVGGPDHQVPLRVDRRQGRVDMIIHGFRGP